MPGLQDRPICWSCTNAIEHSWVYAAPCGHEDCPSVVWHGLCLMEFRENREHQQQQMAKFVEEHRGQWVPGMISHPGPVFIPPKDED
jgi:hypothetical protein